MISRATEAPRSRSRRASDSAAVFSRVKSMMKKSGPASATATPCVSMTASSAAHVEGEAHRRALVAEAAQHVVVAAAAGDRGAEARHVRLEVRARVVVEAAHLAQVEQHGVGEPVDREQPIDLGQVLHGARSTRSLRARAAARSRTPARPKRVGSASSASPHVRPAAPARPPGARASPTSLRARARRSSRWCSASAFTSSTGPRKKSGWPRSSWKRSRPSARRPSMRHGDDLDLGLGLVEPDQLDARLVELAVVRQRGARRSGRRW